MRAIQLILGSHNSQALDLHGPDRESIYEHAYKPFLKLLYNHSQTRFTLYYSGILIEWLEKYHSEFVDVLTEMVKRRQVELLGGPFYEPLLPLIPKSDRIGQIERLTTHLRKCFGRRPRGAWIPGGVWDQRVASNVAAGGIEYIFLPASTFGLHPDGRDHTPILTEDQGKTVTVFPLATDPIARLFHDEPQSIIDRLRRIARGTPATDDPTDPGAVLSLIFDGGEIGTGGLDSDTAAEWYDAFLTLLAANQDWIRVQTPWRVLRDRRPRRIRYAPASPLSDLTEWAGTNGQREGDFSFRSILERYPESARLYAKMHHTHLLVNQIKGDKYRKQTAREELWRGQSHFAYWHNPTGGVYSASLRKATYAALIEAEKMTRERGIFIPALTRVDFDLDGEEEILYQGNEINAYLDRLGGRLFELDFIPRNWNYLDTFERRPEPFHDETSRAAGFDSWPRSAFVDHLLQPDQTFDAFARGERHLVGDLTLLPYEIKSLDKDHNTVVFVGTIDAPDTFGRLEVHKTFQFTKNRIDVSYRFVNVGMGAISASFGSETNLSFYSLDPGKLRMHVRSGRSRREESPESVERSGVTDAQFIDTHNSATITLTPSDKPDFWSRPVQAVGKKGHDLHWFYESTSSVFLWSMELEPGAEQTWSLSLRIDRLKQS